MKKGHVCDHDHRNIVTNKNSDSKRPLHSFYPLLYFHFAFVLLFSAWVSMCPIAIQFYLCTVHFTFHFIIKSVALHHIHRHWSSMAQSNLYASVSTLFFQNLRADRCINTCIRILYMFCCRIWVISKRMCLHAKPPESLSNVLERAERNICFNFGSNAYHNQCCIQTV